MSSGAVDPSTAFMNVRVTMHDSTFDSPRSDCPDSGNWATHVAWNVNSCDAARFVRDALDPGKVYRVAIVEVSS